MYYIVHICKDNRTYGQEELGMQRKLSLIIILRILCYAKVLNFPRNHISIQDYNREILDFFFFNNINTIE